MIVLRALEWLGARARWVLAVGAVAALALQDLAAILRPALPFFVAMIYALAMMRVDVFETVRSALRPTNFAKTIVWSVALIAGLPVVLYCIAAFLGLDAEMRSALVYGHAAPPIASSAAICLLMGFNAAFALEISIVASFLTPIVGPIVVLILLGDAVPLDGWLLAVRLFYIITGGAAAAVILRKVLGQGLINQKKLAFDGIGAVGMLVFIVPLFDGVTAHLLANPGLALEIFALAAVPNFGLQIVMHRITRARLGNESAGALAVMAGNRNVSLFLAALPETPIFSIYAALYQFPMYFTPLIMQRFLRPRFTRP